MSKKKTIRPGAEVETIPGRGQYGFSGNAVIGLRDLQSMEATAIKDKVGRRRHPLMRFINGKVGPLKAKLRRMEIKWHAERGNALLYKGSLSKVASLVDAQVDGPATPSASLQQVVSKLCMLIEHYRQMREDRLNYDDMRNALLTLREAIIVFLPTGSPILDVIDNVLAGAPASNLGQMRAALKLTDNSLTDLVRMMDHTVPRPEVELIWKAIYAARKALTTAPGPDALEDMNAEHFSVLKLYDACCKAAGMKAEDIYTAAPAHIAKMRDERDSLREIVDRIGHYVKANVPVVSDMDIMAHACVIIGECTSLRALLKEMTMERDQWRAAAPRIIGFDPGAPEITPLETTSRHSTSPAAAAIPKVTHGFVTELHPDRGPGGKGWKPKDGDRLPDAWLGGSEKADKITVRPTVVPVGQEPKEFRNGELVTLKGGKGWQREDGHWDTSDGAVPIKREPGVAVAVVSAPPPDMPTQLPPNPNL